MLLCCYGGLPSDDSTLGSMELLEKNTTRLKCATCFLSMVVTFITIALIVTATSYNAYYKSLDSSSSPFYKHTTIPTTTKFMDTKSTTGNIRETSPRNTLLTKNTTRIIHRKRNTSAFPYSDVEFISVPASIENPKSFIPAFHDSSTESVKSKKRERNLKPNLFKILTNKFVELNVETETTKHNHEMRHKIQT